MTPEPFDPRTSATTLLEEFRAFAFKGNVIDLAVGVIIGGAFGNIVKSLVDHIIMPVVGVLVPGNEGYQAWSWTVRGQEILYGRFLAEVVNFLIVAAALFLFVVKLVGWLGRFRQRQAEGKAAEIPPLTKDQQLLTEIRDMLRERA